MFHLPAGGACLPCNSTTCFEGCCTSDGHCHTRGDDDSCGDRGAACVDCTRDGTPCRPAYHGFPYITQCAACTPDCDGKTCGESDGCGGSCKVSCGPGKVCVIDSDTLPNGCHACGPQSCPNGCCTPSGDCIENDYQHPHTCGLGGKACFDCGDQACLGDSCGPCGSKCTMQAGMCVLDGCNHVCPGAQCPPYTICMPVGDGRADCVLLDCGPLTCPNGCCDNGACKTGNLPYACGSGGFQCANCVAMGTTCDTASQTCVSCTPQCANPNSCGAPNGCGGICTGSQGGSCEGTASCNEQGQCVCPLPGQQLCQTDWPNPVFECVDIMSNSARCGSCFDQCQPGSSCVNGKCTCPVGLHYCPQSGCFDLVSDPNNCGWCEFACPEGVSCSHGVCDPCPHGLTRCGSECVDTQTNPKHCSGCGKACSSQQCEAGVCLCPSGTTTCGTVCTNTDIDPQHCGTCFHACDTGTQCVAGQCKN